MKFRGKYLCIIIYLLFVLGGIGCSTIHSESAKTEASEFLSEEKSSDTQSDDTPSLEYVTNIAMASVVVIGMLIISNPVFLLSAL